MDHADDGDDDDDVFVYMGGDQQVPEDVTHVRIHKSVKTIRAWAFGDCRNLLSIEMHDGVEIIEEFAFYECTSLRGIKLLGVRVIEYRAFIDYTALADVEFGDKLETIEECAFGNTSLRNIKIPKVRIIGQRAFACCKQLTNVELSEDLETIEDTAFSACRRLRHITLPLKNNLLGNLVFMDCDDLSAVDLVGGIHKTISSLLLEKWKNEMRDEINQINRDLPTTPVETRSHPQFFTVSQYGKNALIRRWMERVVERVEHYKSEHYVLLKEDIIQLELALWDANLEQQEERLWLKWVDNKQPAKKAKIDIEAVRHEARVTCGANIIIPHVLSFLNDTDEFPLCNSPNS